MSLVRAVTLRTNQVTPHFRPGARFRILPQALCIEVPMSIAKWFSCRVLLRILSLTLAGAAVPASAHPQVVRGVVVDEASGRGLPGVVVVLLDSTGKRLAGVIAGDDGRYAIRTSVPGRFSLRAERIGYRADAPTSVALKIGETVELRLVTRPIPVVLGAVRVTDKSPCVTGASDGREVSTVWDETRKALYATDLTQREELFTARVSRFERMLDGQSGRVTSYQTKQSTGVTRSPFVSLAAAQLSAGGYVRQSSTETVYYGPDATVLVSDEFLRDHCFRLKAGEGRNGGLIGLAFEPVKGRDKADIAGTLWVDRKTAELRNLDYVYRQLPNLPTAVKSEDFGGRIEFRHMPTGAWIVERWVIRMPMLVDKGRFATRTDAIVPGTAPKPVERIQLAGVREEGGEVVETVSRGDRRTAASAVTSIRGTVFDSTRMLPLRNARVFLDGTQFATRSGDDGRFVIGEVPPGTYGLSVAHARFDSLQLPSPSASVSLRADEETVASLAGPSTATIVARDCTAQEQAAGRSMIRGRVLDASSGDPAIDARVLVTWNHMETSGSRPVGVTERRAITRTDSAGRYDLCGLPDGVRLTALVTVDERRSAPVQVVLPDDQINVLDIAIGNPTVVAAAEPAKPSAGAVRVTAPRNRAMQEFERRRRRGNGVYMTRAQVDRQHASRLTDLLRTMPGVSVTPSESGALVVELRRTRQYTFNPQAGARPDSGAPPPTLPDQVGGPLALKKCPAGFLVDGLPIDNSGSADVDVHPEMVEAIEVYAGGQVPIEYAARNSDCGLVMIWTRNFAGRPDLVPGRDGER